MTTARVILLAALFSLSACFGNAVPDGDKAEKAFNEGDIAAARIHIRNALDGAQPTPRLTYLNGRIALEDGNPDLAQTEFAKLLDDPKLGAESRIYLAQAQLMSGNTRKALDTLGDQRDANGLAVAVAVSALAADGKVDEAAEMLDQGLTRFPDSADLLLLDGARALQLADTAKAAKLARRAAALAPKDPDVALLQARVAMENHDLAGAGKHLDRALVLRPNNQLALLGKASVAHDSGKTAEAKEWLDKAAAALGGRSSMAVVLLDAEIAMEEGQLIEAEKKISAIKDFDNFPEAYRVAGLVSARRGQKEVGMKQLRSYFRLGGDDLAARLTLANMYYETQQYAEAWKFLQPAADAPNANGPVLALAYNTASKLNLPGAQRYLVRAQGLSFDQADAKQMVAAQDAMRQGDWKGAEKAYATLLANPANANNVVALNNYANVLERTGQYEKAVKFARQAHALAKDDPTVRDTLGWALFKANGYSQEALQLVETALAANPNNRTVQAHYLAIASAGGAPPQ